MAIRQQRTVLAILRALARAGRPLGAAALSRALADWGVDLGERMVRNYLAHADQAGLTRNLGRRGRVITDQGRSELALGIAVDRVGFVASRVDELVCQMTFDSQRLTGKVIVNVSLIRTGLPLREVLAEMRVVMDAQLGMGRRMLVLPPGENVLGLPVPKDHLGLATVCSVTLNGIMLRHGVVMASRFGGLLELHDGRPVRFRHIINYDGSTLDPLEVFIKGRMTSVRPAARSGTGAIGVSFREIPLVALPQAQQVMRLMHRLDLGTVVLTGRPNQPLLDVPVSPGRVGLIVAGGLNPIAALEEMGVATESTALHSLCEFTLLQPIESILESAS